MATSEHTAPTAPTARPHPAYSALVGLTTLGVLLQAVWAGLFMRRGAAGRDTWVTVHNVGAQVTIVLALLAAIAAFVWMRDRRPALIGTVGLLVLLVVEMGLGMAIDDSSGLVAVHVPLAMLIMALAVWLPFAARR